MKKLASLILALAMCFALGVPAFATSQEGNLTTELTSMLPELKLTLPEAATIILNPYRNTVTDATATASTGIDKGDRLQVMNAVFSIASKTTNKVHVSATVTGSVGGNVEFATQAIPANTAGHKVHLTLTYQLATGANPLAPVPDKETNATNVKTISDSEQTLQWDIPAYTGSNDAATQRLNLQFGGTCSDSPTAEEGPWTESDTVSAAFVFTATPVTDDPMFQTVYQATNASTAKDWTISINPPADFKTLTAPGITKIEYRDATATSYTELAAGNDNWGGDAEWASNGKTLTLKAAKIATVLNALAITEPAVKVVKFTMEYNDDKSVTHETSYTFKVNVLVPPPAPTANP